MLRSKSTDKKKADKNSLALIWLTIIATVSIAVYISMAYYVPLFSNPAFRYVGIVIIILGIILRLVAVASLGKLFNVDVTIRQNHRLKQDAISKYLRHSSHFASLLSFIEFGISLNNWISLFLITIAILFAFITRIKIEEKVLIEQFDKEYIEYKKTTSGLIPFIY